MAPLQYRGEAEKHRSGRNWPAGGRRHVARSKTRQPAGLPIDSLLQNTEFTPAAIFFRRMRGEMVKG